jgi:hypothetical protein
MPAPAPATVPVPAARPSGAGAAAVLAAGVGSLALAVLAMAADRSATLQHLMVWYRPTGPLSGVTTSAIIVWLGVWGTLTVRWGKREVALRPICAISLALLVLGLLLTFPPLADLF